VRWPCSSSCSPAEYLLYARWLIRNLQHGRLVCSGPTGGRALLLVGTKGGAGGEKAKAPGGNPVPLSPLRYVRELGHIPADEAEILPLDPSWPRPGRAASRSPEECAIRTTDPLASLCCAPWTLVELGKRAARNPQTASPATPWSACTQSAIWQLDVWRSAWLHALLPLAAESHQDFLNNGTRRQPRPLSSLGRGSCVGARRDSSLANGGSLPSSRRAPLGRRSP
jgi:hypothetical protein